MLDIAENRSTTGPPANGARRGALGALQNAGGVARQEGLVSRRASCRLMRQLVYIINYQMGIINNVHYSVEHLAAGERVLTRNTNVNYPYIIIN